MSKTIFTNAKSVTFDGATPNQTNEPVLPNQTAEDSTYKALGASKWKALTSMGDVADYIGGAVKYEIDNGPLSGNPNLEVRPEGQFGLRIRKPVKDEYTQFFKKVEPPPTVNEVTTVFPNDGTSLDGYLDEAKVLYQDYRDYYEGRRAIAEKALKGGQLSTDQIDVMRQLIGELDKVITVTEGHIKTVNELIAKK